MMKMRIALMMMMLMLMMMMMMMMMALMMMALMMMAHQSNTQIQFGFTNTTAKTRMSVFIDATTK